ncbi:UNVERIFIED_CONTAM: hypothetical protein H355_010474 [Colinus virginianus]|nr:hypothetical protein H355_010474 [Colinus virginianus]
MAAGPAELLAAVAALLCVASESGVGAAAAVWTAWLNVSWEDGADGNRSGWEAGESGLYGQDSPLQAAAGLLVLPDGRDAFNACSALTNFSAAPSPPPGGGGGPGWVALIQRGGGCSFADKIRLAAERGAAAAVIYNYRGTGNDVLPMSHADLEDKARRNDLYKWKKYKEMALKMQMPVRNSPVCSLAHELGPLRWLQYNTSERGFRFSFAGAGSIVAIMIGNLKGMEILRRIESGLKVTMVIEVGKKHGPLMNYYSIFFVSVSFFVVTAAIMGYFIFYSARRFRVSRAQSRAQRQLKAKAKKAVGKLQLRTLKEGDKEDEGAGAVSLQTGAYAVTSTVAFVNEVENSTENESSGDTSVQAPVEIPLVERQPPEICSLAHELGPLRWLQYNTSERGFRFSFAGAGSIVAIMISSLEGMEILRRIESGLKVTMVIEVGKKHGPLMNYYSILFLSESLIVLTVLITGYSTFYYARRFRLSRAQRQLKAKAKKALGKMKLRTLKEGDKETGPDGDTCAVCIDLYKPDEVVRILACNHVFHKICVDPWLLEHRTCPLCKYDILRVLSPEVSRSLTYWQISLTEDEGAGAVSVQTRVYSVTSTVAFVNEVENSTENESSGDTSVQAPVEIALVDCQPPENDDACLVSDESQPSAESVLPPVENPTFEADETQVSEDKL